MFHQMQPCKAYNYVAFHIQRVVQLSPRSNSRTFPSPQKEAQGPHIPFCPPHSTFSCPLPLAPAPFLSRTLVLFSFGFSLCLCLWVALSLSHIRFYFCVSLHQSLPVSLSIWLSPSIFSLLVLFCSMKCVHLSPSFILKETPAKPKRNDKASTELWRQTGWG